MNSYTLYELPFTARPQYVNVHLGGLRYRFKLAWNVPANCWILDILSTNGTPIACGLPIVTGSDMLAQFDYLGIGGQMLVTTDQTRGDGVPTYEGLGITGHVYFFPDNSQPL